MAPCVCESGWGFNCIREGVLCIVFIRENYLFPKNQYICIVVLIQSFIILDCLKALLTNSDSPVVIIGGEFTCVPDIRTTHHPSPSPPPVYPSIVQYMKAVGLQLASFPYLVRISFIPYLFLPLTLIRCMVTFLSLNMLSYVLSLTSVYYPATIPSAAVHLFYLSSPFYHA
jgi:hypothetical protein